MEIMLNKSITEFYNKESVISHRLFHLGIRNTIHFPMRILNLSKSRIKDVGLRKLELPINEVYDSRNLMNKRF